MTDEQLLCAFGDGCQDAFNTLCNRHRGPVVRYLTTVLRDETLAEDATQETFLRVSRYYSSFKPSLGSTFTSWLFAIANNCARDIYKQTCKQCSETTLFSEEDDFTEPVEPDLDNVDHSDTISNLMRGLTEQQRLAVQLVYLEQMSYQEASVKLQCSQVALRKTVSRALRFIRDRYTVKAA